MAEEDMGLDQLVETFRKRGISCSDLKRKEEQRLSLAREARKDGFEATARTDEIVADKLKQVRKKVCLLK